LEGSPIATRAHFIFHKKKPRVQEIGVMLRRSGVPKHGMVLSCVMDFVNLCQVKKEKEGTVYPSKIGTQLGAFNYISIAKTW
jgi:hypothetical protein